MTRWQVCHHSGRVLFTTDNEVTARNREQFGWKVIEIDNNRRTLRRMDKRAIQTSLQDGKSDSQ